MSSDEWAAEVRRHQEAKAAKAATKRGLPPLRFTPASKIEEKSVEWLWHRRVPLRALTLLVGDPGEGKSLLTMELAARVSRGQPIGPSLPGQPRAVGPGVVLVLSSEDAADAVVVPRLRLAGADMELVYVLTEDDDGVPFTIPGGVERLAAFVEEMKPLLVTIDPITEFLDETINPHRTADIRRALRPLGAVAERLGPAILGAEHLNKATGLQAIYRASGAIGLVGKPRSVLVMGRPPKPSDPNPSARVLHHSPDPTRLLGQIKTNYGLLAETIELAVNPEPGEEHPKIGWRGVVGLTADEILMGQSAGRPPAERSAAAEFLANDLADGPQKSRDVYTRAEAAGHKPRTVRRAKDDLGVVSRQRGGKGPWWWWLPGQAPAWDRNEDDRPGGQNSSRSGSESGGDRKPPDDDEIAHWERLADPTEEP